MAIHKMNFAEGIFFAKQVDYVDNVDAKMWLSALNKYAKNSATPIFAIVDAIEVNRLCPTVLKLFEDAQNLPNVRGIAIATGDFFTSQKARVISSLSEMQGIRICTTVDEAQRFADLRLHASAGAGAGRGSFPAQAYSSFSMFSLASVG